MIKMTMQQCSDETKILENEENNETKKNHQSKCMVS